MLCCAKFPKHPRDNNLMHDTELVGPSCWEGFQINLSCFHEWYAGRNLDSGEHLQAIFGVSRYSLRVTSMSILPVTPPCHGNIFRENLRQSKNVSWDIFIIL